MRQTFTCYVGFLFLWISPNYVNTFSCIVSDIHRFQPVSVFDLDQIRNTISSLDTESYGYNTTCKVQFYKVHDHLAIWFGNTVTDRFYPKDSEIYSSIMLNLEDSDIIENVLEYSCSKPKECDRHFVLDHIKWFLELNVTQIRKTIKPLLTKRFVPSGMCYTNSEKISLCFNKYCASVSWTNNTEYQFKCENDINTAKIYIEAFIMPTMISNDGKKDKHDNTFDEILRITYYCKYIGCNSRKTTNQIHGIVKQQYCLSSMRNILNYTCEKHSIMITSISNTISSLTTSIEHIESTLPTMNTMLESIKSSTYFILSTPTDVSLEATIVVSPYSAMISTDLKSSISFVPEINAINEVIPTTSIPRSSATMSLESHSIGEHLSVPVLSIIWIILTNFVYYSYFQR